MSAYLGGKERVVRMTSTSEGSEREVRITFQACQGIGVFMELEEVPPPRSGDPIGFSRMIGDTSSRGMREVSLSASCWSSHGMREAKSAAGGSIPTLRMRSGRAERGSDCGMEHRVAVALREGDSTSLRPSLA